MSGSGAGGVSNFTLFTYNALIVAHSALSTLVVPSTKISKSTRKITLSLCAEAEALTQFGLRKSIAYSSKGKQPALFPDIIKRIEYVGCTLDQSQERHDRMLLTNGIRPACRASHLADNLTFGDYNRLVNDLCNAQVYCLLQTKQHTYYQ